MPTGQLAALATALAWSATSLFFAEAARRIGALRTNLLRLPIALLFLSVTLSVTAHPLRDLDVRASAYLAVSGVVGLVVGDLALFASMRRLGVRLAMLVMALAPAFAALAGFALLREIPRAVALLGMVTTLAGVAWVVSEPHGDESRPHDLTRGIVLAIVGAACQGTGLVLAKLGMGGTVQALPATWVRMGVATIVIWLLTVVTGKAADLEIGVSVRRAWRFLLGGAFFGPFLGVWFSLIAARSGNVGVAATIMATTPVLVIPPVMAFEHYRPTTRALLGTAVTIAGVALLFTA
ncbi:MAG: DMT family transporter [Thermoanaerobaculales bacterium]